MDRPNYDQIRERLSAAGDAELLRCVRILDAVFRSPRLKPLAETVDGKQRLIEGVTADFPTPFSRKFIGWLDAEAEYEQAFARWQADAGTGQLGDRAISAVSRHFRDSFLEMWTCWLQIVRFLPFILISALKRLDDETLKQHAAKELALALYHYRTFYEKYDSERKREADQLHLLTSLNRLFRRLWTAGVLQEHFVFLPLIEDRKAGFAELFPDRFDAQMQLILQLRNRVIHDHLEAYGPEITSDLHDLVRWCFLDVIAVLAPISRAFSLTYVIKLLVGPSATEVAEAEALDFSGAQGPRTVRYRISTVPQLDDFSFVDLRLYLIARSQQGAAAGAAPLEPRHYLDLTPFLIAERLRTQVQAQREVADAEGRRLLFALQQYLEPLSQLTFSELGGTNKRNVTGGQGDVESRLLLEKISGFKLRISRLSAQIQLGDGSNVSVRTGRQQLWTVSAGYLSSLLDIQAYDSDGEKSPSAAASGLKLAFDQDLFVDPPEGAIADSFFGSPQRCLLLIGGSGFGKSNLLVSRYLKMVRQGRLAVFLTARQFEEPAFREVLRDKVVRQISGKWQEVGDLDAFLDENGEMLAIFIDAINEYTGPRGPLSLLADLINAVKSEGALRRCKIVATCRSETWARYLQQIGNDRPLDPSIFLTRGGDVVRVAGFADPALRERLYAAYQRRYRLKPPAYGSLSEPIRELIAHPLMMALIAEGYANTDAGERAQQLEVPRELDYFTLFRRLTDRKLADAQVLIPPTERLERDALPRAIEELCLKLAGLIYERLIAGGTASDGSNRDSLPLELVDKRPDLQPYVRGGYIAALEAALQVGLLDQIRVSMRNASGRMVGSSALAFFHDQYTQFWLAHVYQGQVLGWLDQNALADPARISLLTDKVSEIIGESVNAPVLLGALDHWLQMNLENFHRSRLEPAIPLLNGWAESEHPAVRHYAVSTVANLILRRYAKPEEVFPAIFRTGDKALRYEVSGAFVDYWPALPPAAAAAFIDSCDPDIDPKPIERLGDIFTLHVMLDPEGVGAYLEAAVKPLSLTGLFDRTRLARQFKFALQFSIFAVMTSFDDPRVVETVRKFFRSKYQVAIDLLIGAGSRGILAPAKAALREFLYSRFDKFGAEQWDKFIGGMPLSGNNDFYVERDGVVQQKVMEEFLPYVCDLHNGELERLSLEPDAPFRKLVLRMLDYKPTSIIGYNATLCLPTVLRGRDWSVTESLVKELIERRTMSASFFGNLILCNLSYTDIGFARPSLELVRDWIAPLVLRERLFIDWSTMCCIATLDAAGLWDVFEGILRLAFDELERRGDPVAIKEFGSAFFKISYCRDLELGRRTIEMLCRERERFLGPVWRETTLQLFAAMLTRHPATLQASLVAAGIEDSILREARAYQTPEVIELSRMFPFQVDVNRYAAWLYASQPRMRESFIKHFIGWMVFGTSIPDFAAGVRQTLVSSITYHFAENPETLPLTRLSVPEIAAAVAAGRKNRGGSATQAGG